jgi:predicted nucleic acid-binding protein
MRIALDTNILIYAEGLNDPARKRQARDLIASLARADVVLSVQVAGELFQVLVRKSGRTPAEARTIVEGWQELYGRVPTGERAFAEAMALAAAHGLDIWDSCIVAAAAEAGCRVLLSEDLSDGFTWRGLTIVNPFSPEPHPLLAGIGVHPR